MAPNDAMTGCATLRDSMRDAARLDAGIHITDCVFPCCDRRTVAEGSTERPVLDLPPPPCGGPTGAPPSGSKKRNREGRSDEEMRNLAQKIVDKQAEWRAKKDIANRAENERDDAIAQVRAEMIRRGVRIIMFPDGTHVNFQKRKMASPNIEELAIRLRQKGFTDDQIFEIQQASKGSDRVVDDVVCFGM